MTKIRYAITQGQHVISDEEGSTISTLLGSCVACCIWDPVLGVGGMNHMLLANRAMRSGTIELGGINEMELLINALLKRGARRDRLLAKAFGGASMVAGLSEIGAANGASTLKYLDREGITCVSSSLGGSLARQLIFWPTTGAVKQKLVKGGPLHVEQELPIVPKGNDVELL